MSSAAACRPLYVVACSSRKTAALQAGPVAARDAYAGRAFLAARDWLEKTGSSWCILSGLYGFLWPDTVIENYDVKMEPVTAENAYLCEFFDAIKQKQYGRLRAARRVIVIGSKLYADAVAVLLDRPVDRPLAGLGIGRQFQKISRGEFLLPRHQSAAA